MNILVLNGSPRPTGTVATLLRTVVDQLGPDHTVEWVDAYRQQVRPCTACMRCRPDGRCCLPEDDGHRVGGLLRNADAVVIGTPVHWGNMSAPLKALFDRNVPALMGESHRGLPVPKHQGKPAVIVTACTTPWPFDRLAGQSRGAIRAVWEVLRYSGFRRAATVVAPGTKGTSGPSTRALRSASQAAGRLLAAGKRSRA